MNEEVESVKATKQSFWNAVKIYYERPNSINKQIVLSHHLFCGLLHQSFLNSDQFLNVSNEIFTCLYGNDENSRLSSKNQFTAELKRVNCKDAFDSSSGTFLLIRKLISKKSIIDIEFYEFLALEKDQTKLYIHTKHNKSSTESCQSSGIMDPLSILKYTFINLEYYADVLKLQYDSHLGEKGINWLRRIFLPKFKTIMTNSIESNSDVSCNESRLLYDNVVDVVDYYKLYEQMKNKYADNLIKNWTENTDPKKYVYEDIGIASYLLLLWKDKRFNLNGTVKQRFLDLGCGNGLLVHILNSEGHLGIGLDIRKRKIWDSYSEETILKEETIIPTANKVYPEVDWLIGNHSDELTPWLPIMARKNGGFCQYFVLPCCPYMINGRKFQRLNSSLSSYRDFINYVKGISELCNFETFIDRLRIPSTKRVCLIGLRKAASSEENNAIDDEIKDFIKINCQIIGDGNKVNDEEGSFNTQWSPALFNLKIRDTVEKVRNCTKLHPDVINGVLRNVMAALLKYECYVELNRDGSVCTWNKGGRLLISDLARSVDPNLLRELKKECKGLQTLLKNHHYLFEVGGAMVQFRDPQSLENMSDKHFQRRDKSKWKNRKCWFHENHPNGCPLSENKCSYKH